MKIKPPKCTCTIEELCDCKVHNCETPLKGDHAVSPLIDDAWTRYMRGTFKTEGEDWEKDFYKEFVEVHELLNHDENLVLLHKIKVFIKKLLKKEKKKVAEDIHQWAKEKNMCSDLIGTSDLMRYLRKKYLA